jgi:putative peptide zinc metalloprotease protein
MMTSRPLSIGIGARMRPDLVMCRQQSDSRECWVIKDPVSLRYYNLSTHEHAILNWLDGTSSLDDIRRKFEEQFPPFRMTARRLQAFLANLYESGLLIVEGQDQGKLLLESRERQERRERWQKWLSWLAIRFRGIDPDPFLLWLYPKVRWCFSRWFVVGGLIVALVAVMQLIVHASQFRQQLPQLHEFLSPSNLLWLAVAFAGVKVLHELGHALACKHYGGECHEMGVMLLFFVPCLYCNVTDSWMLQSRWHRIAVSAAGIVVELMLAAIAVLCWRFFQPGLLQTIALNTIIVCSVGTLFFNGNPLLRYDGYFVLADLVGIPNLWQESRTALRRKLAKWFLTPEATVNTPPADHQGLLTVYGIASIAYRVFVVSAILLFFHRLLVPKGLGGLMPLVLATFAAGAGVAWFGVLRRFWSKPMAWRLFNFRNVLFAAGTAAIGLALILAMPFPCRIAAPVVLQPVSAHRIYVSTPGSLQDCVSPGDSVHANAVLARLEDIELQRDVMRLTGELQLARTRVQNLHTRLSNEPEVAAQLQVAEEMLATVEQQFRQRQRDAERLILKSPVAGLVMEPPTVPTREAEDDRLPTWTGTPMDAKNAKCYLDRGTLLCLVGDPARQEAVLFIDETDVQYVRVDQRVRVLFPVAPTVVLAGRVEEIAKRNILTVPNELAVEQTLANRPDATGARRPLRTSYSVRVALDDHDVDLLTGARGSAKISVEPQTLGQRLLHVLRRTLTVEL